MAGRGDIKIKITGDNKSLKNALGQSESGIKRFSRGVVKGAAVAAAGIATVGTAVVAAGLYVNNAGLQLEQMEAKSATVFGNSLGDVQKWASGLSSSLGMTKTELTGAAANMADLLKPMGFTSQEAANMSTQMLDLSGALSSWSAGQYDAKEVSEILSKAMLGEREQLKALGISITEADVQARLAEKGQKDLTGAALAQAKALATQELIMEKSTDAQKAWADGSADALKSQNALKTSLKEARETLVKAFYPTVKALIPVLTSAATALGAMLPGAIEKVKSVVANVWPVVQAVFSAWVTYMQEVGWPAIKAIFSALSAAVTAVVGWFQTNWPTIQAVIATTVAFIQENVIPAVQVVVGWLVEQFGLLVAWVQENWPLIRDTIAETIEAVRVVIEATLAVIAALWNTYGATIMQYVTATWEVIKTVISNAIQLVMNVVRAVMAIIRGDWGQAWDSIKAALANVWEIIKALITQALNYIKALLGVAWATIKAAASAAWSAIKALISLAWDGIKAYVMLQVNAVKAVISGAWNAIKSATSGAWNAIKSAVSSAIDGAKSAVSNAATATKNALVNAWDAAKTLVTDAANGMKTAVSTAISNIVSTVTGLPGTIKDIFSDAGSWLLNAGKEILAGLIRGITEKIEALKDKLSSVTNLIPSWKGPPERDRNLLYDNGRLVMDSFTRGLSDRIGGARQLLQGFTNELGSPSTVAIAGAPADSLATSIASPRSAPTPQTVESGGVTINVEGDAVIREEADLDKLAGAIMAHVQVAGLRRR